MYYNCNCFSVEEGMNYGLGLGGGIITTWVLVIFMGLLTQIHNEVVNVKINKMEVQPDGEGGLLAKMRQCWCWPSMKHLSPEERKEQNINRFFVLLATIVVATHFVCMIFALKSGKSSVARACILFISCTFFVTVILPLLAIVSTPNMKLYVIKGLVNLKERMPIVYIPPIFHRCFGHSNSVHPIELNV